MPRRSISYVTGWLPGSVPKSPGSNNSWGRPSLFCSGEVIFGDERLIPVIARFGELSHLETFCQLTFTSPSPAQGIITRTSANL